MTKEFPMTNAEFSLITRASSDEPRGLPSRRQRGFHRLATLCWERIGHWGYWSFTGHCGIGHWSFAPNANPLEMSRNPKSGGASVLASRLTTKQTRRSAREDARPTRSVSVHCLLKRKLLHNFYHIIHLCIR